MCKILKKDNYGWKELRDGPVCQVLCNRVRRKLRLHSGPNPPQWHTGSFRKNDKCKSRSKGVNFYKILILTPFPGRKIATNYSPTPSRSLRNVLRLPSKVAPPTLAEWKSGTGSPKRASKQNQTGLWPAERSELGSKENFSVIGMQNGFSPKVSALWVHWGPVSTRQLWLFRLLEPDFHSANVGGTTF